MANRRSEEDEYNRHIAKYIAIVIRNAMEDFHAQHLTDDQMKELNPIIRNAIFTALHSLSHMHDSEAAQTFMKSQERIIPKYWEEPQLLDDYVKMLNRRGESV
jgi:hypothetical protein